MDARDFRSELHVPAAPETLWEAITRPASATRRLFAIEQGAAVEVGSRVMQRDDSGEESVWGRVVDLEWPHRLVLELERWEHSEPYRVTLLIEPEGQGSRLELSWEPVGRPPEVRHAVP